MIFLSGVGQIVDGPFIDDNTSADLLIRYKSNMTIQCIANNYLTVQSFKTLSKRDTVQIEGILDEKEVGYPVVVISKITHITSRGKPFNSANILAPLDPAQIGEKDEDNR